MFLYLYIFKIRRHTIWRNWMDICFAWEHCHHLKRNGNNLWKTEMKRIYRSKDQIVNLGEKSQTYRKITWAFVLLVAWYESFSSSGQTDGDERKIVWIKSRVTSYPQVNDSAARIWWEPVKNDIFPDISRHFRQRSWRKRPKTTRNMEAVF